MRYALTGPMYSGKTSLAHALADVHGFALVNYTDYLKELAANALSYIGVETTVRGIKEDKAKYRSFLQDLGTLVDFDNGAYVQRCLVEQAMDRTGFNGLNEDIVFDNVRTQAQFDILRDYGFQLVRLTVNPIVQINRATRAGVTVQELHRVSDHQIESGLPYQDDEIELNGGVAIKALASALMGGTHAHLPGR
jgi:hypothetical protein